MIFLFILYQSMKQNLIQEEFGLFLMGFAGFCELGAELAIVAAHL